jgi:hypothetical protein
MPKIIVSPIRKWPGSVTLQDPLLFPAYMKLKAALDDSQVAEGAGMKMQIALPGLCACVETWELKDLGQITSETFPASPIKASAELFAWLMGEVMALLLEAEEVPNA